MGRSGLIGNECSRPAHLPPTSQMFMDRRTVRVSSSPEPGLRLPPEALEYEAGHILVFFPYYVGVGAELQASRQLQDSHPCKQFTLNCLELLGRQTQSHLQLDMLDRVLFPRIPASTWYPLALSFFSRSPGSHRVGDIL